MTAPVDSLEYLQELFKKNYAAEDDLDPIYSMLSTLDLPRLRVLIDRLNKVDTAETIKTGKAKKTFEGKRSRLKGKLYEQLVSTIVAGVSCFERFENIQTTTNELDVLLILSPAAMLVPALRSWGSHCVCECKYHSGHVSTNWVSKLNTVLQTHGAAVGILFSKKGIANSGRGTAIRQTLQILAVSATPRFIVSLDWDELVACTKRQNFLSFLFRRFVAVHLGIQRLAFALK
jgi:hypothetical protein